MELVPNTQHAVRLADRVWWVGSLIPGDEFQCHTYLIEQGDQSMLLDPGSMINWPDTLRKIEEVTAFENIRWFVCHHPDPDITASLPTLDKLVTRTDARLVTHWRAEELLKHYNIKMQPWDVEKNGWKLPLQDRTVEFVFTPYLHFPGAFCTFDPVTETLFSSDLFGGYTHDAELFAQGEAYFEAMRPFHEHYMPSREHLQHGIRQVRAHPLKLIAPQHGALIRQEFIDPLLDRLGELECGLYLMVRGDQDLRRLSDINRMLREAMRCLTLSRDFPEVVEALKAAISVILPVTRLEFFTQRAELLHFGPENDFGGVSVDSPPTLAAYWSLSQEEWRHLDHGFGQKCSEIRLPLFSPNGKVEGVVVFVLAEPTYLLEPTWMALTELSIPLEVALERALLWREMRLRRQAIYELSIRDPLTQLYNRAYLQEAADRLLAMHDRDEVAGVGLVAFDLDHFKRINDGFGHAAGDQVLQGFAALLRDTCRKSDIPARIGGEEFVLLHACASVEAARALGERLRQQLTKLRFEKMPERGVTTSVGVALRKPRETWADLLARADQALYAAKASGRDRVVVG